jgi:tetratricopeptide (TPR) repeat protein
MADSSETPGPISPEGLSASGEPTAMALAMTGASREEADKFLQHQRRLSDEQNYFLREQLKTQWLGAFLRAATACVGVAFAAALAFMVWEAAHSNGLLIEPFTVPADLAARGLSGPAFSNLLLDKLTLLQEQTQSNRPTQSYANNWGDDLKVEIPETGVSLGEIHRYLREWLGHDTHISGEVWQSAGGLVIVARASSGTGEPVTGPESDLDTLMQKVAENVYRVTQPYRYANYLDRDFYHPGFTDITAAEQIYRHLVNDPRPVERAYAWNGLANLAWTVRSDDAAALAYYQRAGEADPTYPGADFGIAFLDLLQLSRPEAGLAAARDYARKTDASNKTLWLDLALGSYVDGLAVVKRGLATADTTMQQRSQVTGTLFLGQLHDGPGLRDWLRDIPLQSAAQLRSSNALPMGWMRLLADAYLEDWQKVLVSEPQLEKELLANNAGWDLKVLFSRSLRPRLALAKAMTGDIAGAEALIAPAPADCYDCLRIRGQIAAQARQWGRADYWFARAVAAAPSISFAWHDWGRALLARGDAGGAIEKFSLANRKSPHFADPLEGWGEALMAKNQSHLALAKFAEAEKYAPNWGRLHLKWGEALVYAGKPADARVQFTRTAALDLTPAEKAELARFMAGENPSARSPPS